MALLAAAGGEVNISRGGLRLNERLPARMLNRETDRVRRQTPPEILRMIDDRLERSLKLHASQPRSLISLRLRELEREWDIERWIVAQTALFGGVGLLLGMLRDRRWLIMTAGALSLLGDQAIRGTSFSVLALRRAGVRTRSEIDREKFALKALRGDFDDLAGTEPTLANALLRAHDALRAVQA